ncbi:MAG: TolC family protein [Alphaproteobacteria bacterium]|nr:TolC family protein [Alphaproteobacteria bacterium]
MPSHRRWAHVALIVPLLVAAPAMVRAAETAPALTLSEALARATAAAPILRGARAGVDAERGRLDQARLRPNPELSLEVENFAGSRPFRGLDGAELTASVQQPIELGGKRAARMDAGRAALDAAALRAAQARLDLEQAVRRAHAEAAAAQEVLTLARRESEAAAELFRTVSRLVEAGREPPLRQARAQVERTTAEASRLGAEREYEAAKRRLAALTGDESAVFMLDTSTLYQPPRPTGDRAAVDVAVARQDLARARAEVRVERAARIPDPRLTVGVRRLRAEEATAVVAGLAIPFPLFNGNRGAVRAAAAEAVRAEAALAQAEIDARVRAANAIASYDTAQAQAEALATGAVPAAEEAVRVARLGYAAGKFPLLELIEAQRALTVVRRQRVAAALDVARAAADLDRALGRTLLPE